MDRPLRARRAAPQGSPGRVRSARPRHRGRPPGPPAAQAGTLRRLAVHRPPHRAAGPGAAADRIRRDPPLRGLPLRGLGPARGVALLRRRARPLRGAAAAPRQGARLRAARDHGLRGGPVLPDRGRARGRPGSPRGRDLQRADQPRDHHADLHPQARPARDQAGRLSARRYLQSSDADRHGHDSRGRPALLPGCLRPRGPDQREGGCPPRAPRDRAGGQPVAHHHRAERGHQAHHRVGRHVRDPHHDRGGLRDELRRSCPSCSGAGAIPP